jgi:S1-C subfamily serine protease
LLVYQQDDGAVMLRRTRPAHAWWESLAVVLAVGALVISWFLSRGAATAEDVSPPSGAMALQQAYIDVLADVRASVVEISTPQGLGSGVIYDHQGDIVTNAHVVAGASQFRVTLVDGRSMPATLVGTYAPDDLAVVRVARNDLPPVTLGDSAKLEVGEIVLAIGNPLGLSSSVTSGIVSATGRTVSEGHGVVLPATVQTSAAVNPGNSGGGLVDLDGSLVGIPTLAATDPELGGSAPGIGFAIPSNTVKLIADQLIATGKVTDSHRASLGITGATAESLTGQPVGVLVRKAVAPASAAGIKGGDIITSLDSAPTLTLADLQTKLADLAPGKRVTLTVAHPDGSKGTYRVTLGSL